VLRRYVHGPGEDDPILWYEGPGLASRRSLQIDSQGSIVSIADAAGNALAMDAYDEYGIPNAGNIGRFQYTGQAWLPDLGMYYYKARIYSPTLGRFMQTDPIGYRDQINLYAYVANDPINFADPTGQRRLNAYEEAMVANVFVGMPLDLINIYPYAPARSFTAHPRTIWMNNRDYSADYTLESDIGKLNTFWHELYHVFEIATGITTWNRLAANQRNAGFGTDIYRWDPKKSFMHQNPEARAQYFGDCMTGKGSCGALSGFKVQGDNYTITFSHGAFHMDYTFEVTGTRIKQHASVNVAGQKTTQSSDNKPKDEEEEQ
jgi:RHS repeat-associated protein